MSRPGQAPWQSWAGVLLLLAGGFALLFALVRWLARRVFLLDVPNAGPPATSAAAPAAVPAPGPVGPSPGAPAGASLPSAPDASGSGTAVLAKVSLPHSGHDGLVRELITLDVAAIRSRVRATAAARRDLAFKAEYAGDPALPELCEEIPAKVSFSRLTTEGVVHEIRDTVTDHYAEVWSSLADDEKLVAARLAGGAVASPGNPRPTRHLLERGILVREPDLRLMNESFAEWIREEVSPAEIKEWERGHASSAWQRLRFPILLGLAIVGAFLFATQRSAFNSAVAILGAAALGTGTVLKVLGAVKLPGQDNQ